MDITFGTMLTSLLWTQYTPTIHLNNNEQWRVIEFNIDANADGYTGSLKFIPSDWVDFTYHPNITITIDGEDLESVVTQYSYNTNGVATINFTSALQGYQQNGAFVKEIITRLQQLLTMYNQFNATLPGPDFDPNNSPSRFEVFVNYLRNSLNNSHWEIMPCTTPYILSPIKLNMLLEEIRNGVANMTPYLSLLKKIAYYGRTVPIVRTNNFYFATELQIIEMRYTNGQEFGEFEVEFPTRSMTTYPTGIGSTIYIVNDSLKAITNFIELGSSYGTWSLIINGYGYDNAYQSLVTALLSGYYQHEMKTVIPLPVWRLVGYLFENPYNNELSLITGASMSIGQNGIMVTIRNTPYHNIFTIGDINSEALRRQLDFAPPENNGGGGGGYA